MSNTETAQESTVTAEGTTTANAETSTETLSAAEPSTSSNTNEPVADTETVNETIGETVQVDASATEVEVDTTTTEIKKKRGRKKTDTDETETPTETVQANISTIATPSKETVATTSTVTAVTYSVKVTNNSDKRVTEPLTCTQIAAGDTVEIIVSDAKKLAQVKSNLTQLKHFGRKLEF